MPTYVVLYKLTDQGIKHIKTTVERAIENQIDSERRGFKIREVYWTQGQYDVVAIMDACDDETMMAGLLNIASAGYARSETLRAYTAHEMVHVIRKM
jgi:uncharacterized protein with GYD domain